LAKILLLYNEYDWAFFNKGDVSMRIKALWCVLLITFFALTACGAPATEEPTPIPPAPEPTPVPPTVPPEPTVEPSPELTSTPEKQIFRDDFTGELQPGWTWESENPDRWTITDDGWLQIIGEDSSLLADEQQSNLLWMDLPGGDFVITVHMKAQPIVNFQQATLYIYEDPDN